MNADSDFRVARGLVLTVPLDRLDDSLLRRVMDHQILALRVPDALDDVACTAIADAAVTFADRPASPAQASSDNAASAYRRLCTRLLRRLNIAWSGGAVRRCALATDRSVPIGGTCTVACGERVAPCEQARTGVNSGAPSTPGITGALACVAFAQVARRGGDLGLFGRGFADADRCRTWTQAGAGGAIDTSSLGIDAVHFRPRLGEMFVFAPDLLHEITRVVDGQLTCVATRVVRRGCNHPLELVT